MLDSIGARLRRHAADLAELPGVLAVEAVYEDEHGQYGAEALDYCFATLLPTWERFTNNHPAMRRALECASADPQTHVAGRHSAARMWARDGYWMLMSST